jgi:hypothetical protein
MKIVLLAIAGSQPLVANVISEDEDFLNVEHPVALFRDDSHVYSTPFMPFAKAGMVAFSKTNVIGIAPVEDEIKQYYLELLESLRERKIEVKKPSSSKKIEPLKFKNLH